MSKADDFAVLPIHPTASILPAIENSTGKIEVCVGLIGFSPADREGAANGLTSRITKALREWIALLEGNELWSLTEPVTPAFAVQDSECSTNLPGFAVNLWATPERFKADYCSRQGDVDGDGCASAAQLRTLYLGPWNRGQEVDAATPRTVLHELGHLLGLADTYRVPGMHEWTGEQPSSVMSGGASVLTDDDKRGLAVVLRTLKTGIRSCDGFGAEVPMEANVWNSIMCDPAAVPEDNHGRPPQPLETILPRAGIWSYAGYDEGRTEMRVAGVTKTETGYVMRVAPIMNENPNEGAYACDAAGVCASQNDAGHRMLVASATSMRMLNPTYPAGIQLEFDRPE